LRLGQRNEIGRILRLQLNRSLQMLHRSRKVVVLNELEQTEEMMRRREVRHQFQRFMQFEANVRRFVGR
jgi:hypothetical protein